ncbi:sperm-associated microtubule inner protein 4 [Clinocottus analis]|uniref:sperm-associated microtubule inner protein 4 n=1 Tax=Clinocottus analis TaxID=304258 RepID=UPI0035C0A5C2
MYVSVPIGVVKWRCDMQYICGPIRMQMHHLNVHTILMQQICSKGFEVRPPSSQMEPKASLNHGIPPDLNGHSHFACGGTIVTEPTSGQQRYNNTGRKKSKLYLNDQLIPKPTDINMVEKMIKIATPKQHPYSSHISQFAMFPSFRSPDDHETGVRAASQHFLNPLVPTKAPDVTLLSKTIGGPYRHEVLETPKNRKKGVTWTGEHGFLDPLKGENQVFYPTPPKTMLPNPTLRHRELSLSERTSNMLKNLERAQWVTSYQMHHTGSGPANPLLIDDFKERICDMTGMNTHAAPLRERSFPVFVPSKPRGGCRKRQQRSTCSLYEGRERDIQLSTSQINPEANNTAGISGAEQLLDMHTTSPLSREEMAVDREKSMTELRGGHLSSVSQPSVVRELAGTESNADLSPRAVLEQEMLAEGRELPGSVSDLCILPRPHVLPGIRPVDRVGTVGRGGAALRLRDLQNNFSKSKAHRDFNCSISHAAVNLRDNVVAGKKHNFYGINCYYLHG